MTIPDDFQERYDANIGAATEKEKDIAKVARLTAQGIAQAEGADGVELLKGLLATTLFNSGLNANLNVLTGWYFGFTAGAALRELCDATAVESLTDPFIAQTRGIVQRGADKFNRIAAELVERGFVPSEDQ
jgi:hypothetical protein